MTETSKCQWFREGYPHPGCAEFGPPDVFTCSAPAEYRMDVEGSWFTQGDKVTYFVCLEHLKDTVEDHVTAVGGDTVTMTLRKMTEFEEAGHTNPVDLGPAQAAEAHHYGDTADTIAYLFDAIVHTLSGTNGRCYLCYCQSESA